MDRSTLKQYRSIVDEINDLDAEISELDSRPDLFINLTLDLDTQLEKLRSIRKEIEDRMWRLTSQERRVIRKKYFYRMSYKEIAAEMKCSVDHVKKTAWHAVKKMEEEGDQHGNA